MSDITRRSFLKGAQAGMIAVGVVAVAPVAMATSAGALQTTKKSSASPSEEARAIASSETIVVHIPNPRSGEIRLMVGEREIVRHDRALVARLIRDVR